MTRTIGILIFPDFQLLDMAGPVASFELASRGKTPPAYRVRVLARAPGPVASSAGVAITAEGFADAGPLDTLIVAGGIGSRETEPRPETLDWLRAAARRRIGCGRRCWPTATRWFGSSPTGSSCATATSGPRPGLPPASTLPWP